MLHIISVTREKLAHTGLDQKISGRLFNGDVQGKLSVSLLGTQKLTAYMVYNGGNTK